MNKHCHLKAKMFTELFISDLFETEQEEEVIIEELELTRKIISSEVKKLKK